MLIVLRWAMSAPWGSSFNSYLKIIEKYEDDNHIGDPLTRVQRYPFFY